MRVKDARQTFLGVWIRLLLEGKPFEVWEGQQLRDFTFVDDCVNALLAAAAPEARGRVFNLGGLERISLAELAELLVGLHGSGSFVRKDFPPDRKRIDVGDYWADDGLIRATLGWEPKVPLREGLERTLAYYRVHLKEYC
jgi:nucleoside-diphosphate-sugar epimerase